MPFKIFARGLAYSHDSISTRIFSDDCDRAKYGKAYGDRKSSICHSPK